MNISRHAETPHLCNIVIISRGILSYINTYFDGMARNAPTPCLCNIAIIFRGILSDYLTRPPLSNASPQSGELCDIYR